MKTTRAQFLLRVAAGLAGLALAATGCQLWPLDTSADSSGADGTSSAEQVLSGNTGAPLAADEVAEAEPNDSFAGAQPVSFNETVRLSGAIGRQTSPQDRDVFDLGPAGVGDRVLADLTIESGTDVVLGIFDADDRILGYIDLSSTSAGPRQSDFVLRENTDHLYVAMGTRSTSNDDRPYVARVAVQRGLGQIVTRPQIVVLNFQGASGVSVGNRTAVNVPPFDAASINAKFAGQTQTMINLILNEVRADFAGLEVSIYVAGDPAIPAGDHSTVYFGTYNSRLLGLADNVDPYNADTTQSAILYTDTFAIFNALSPTVAQMSQALANTASHEAGHLLGLRHTADVTDIMDTTATARQMMLNQDFSLANLNSSVAPIGLQDAPALLAWALGGALSPASSKPLAWQKAINAAGQADDFYIPRAWLMDCACSDCGQP